MDTSKQPFIQSDMRTGPSDMRSGTLVLEHNCDPYSTVFIDGYAYVLRGENTVSCLDMRNPASLAHAGELKYDVGYDGGRIYQIAEKHVVIVGGLGVQVMKITLPGEATAMPAATAAAMP